MLTEVLELVNSMDRDDDYGQVIHSVCLCGDGTGRLERQDEFGETHIVALWSKMEDMLPAIKMYQTEKLPIWDAERVPEPCLPDPPMSPAAVKVFNSILHARIPEENILRDYDEDQP